MATPKITDVVNGQGYKADGVQFSLNPTTGRYQEDFGAKIPKEDLASFQKANPGLTFDAQDYAAYNDPNSYVYRMPSEVSPKMDFNSFTKPQVQGSMASPYIPTADMSPVAQATAGTAEQIVKESQAQAQNTQAAQTEQAIADYVKKYLGLSGDTSVAEQKAAETAQLTQQAGISETTSKLKDLATKMEALNIQTEAEKQAILASPIGGITSADLSGREQEITRKNNISRLNLAAESLVLQGKLDSANTAIKNAIDLKYAPQEARYKAVLEFNTINEKILGKEAEKQKDLANAKIKDLEEKKKNDTEIATLITEAIPNAPADVISRAKKLAESGASKLAVAQSLGVYGGDYLKNELFREQIKTERSKRLQVDTKTSLLTPQPTGIVTAPNGDAIGIPNETLAAIGKLKLNEGQANAVAFTSRMIQSAKAIDSQLGKIKPTGGFYETEGYDPTSLGSGFGRVVGSDKSRVYDTNSKDFIRAKLRKESGATITDEEMAADAQIYTPSGMGLDEKDLILAQTKRDEAIKSMIAQSGPAAPYLQQYYEQSKTRGYDYDPYLDGTVLPAIQKSTNNSGSSSAYADSLLSN